MRHKKREAWDDLIALFYQGQADHWSGLHDSMREARGMVLLEEAGKPLQLLVALDWFTHMEVKAISLEGLHFPDVMRSFREILPDGEERDVPVINDQGRVWLEMCAGREAPLGSEAMMGWLNVRRFVADG